MKKSLILIILLLITFLGYSQTEIQKSWLVISADNYISESYFNQPFLDILKINNPSFSVGLHYYINDYIDAAGTITLGKISWSNSPSEGAKTDDIKANFNALKAEGIFKFNNDMMLKKSSKIAPFFSAGIGTINYRHKDTNSENGVAILLPVSVGAKYQFSENLNIVVKASQNTTSKGKFRGISFGLSVALRNRIDTDKDGVLDEVDQCPKLFGYETNNGCPYPDSDLDGFYDDVDECPLIPGKLKGCPDTDEDGIKDSMDDCPELYGSADHNGCPDEDGDGIIDTKDLCPKEYGPSILNGCPLSADLFTHVLFKFNSDEFAEKSQESLLKLAALSSDKTEIRIILNGYTDNIGQPKANVTLSKLRAEKVKNLLITHGARGNQITVVGMGEVNPTHSNDNEKGRSKNRRVEIEIILPK